MTDRPPLYFIRHGETDWNRQGLIQGWIDIALNDTGHMQARAIGKALAALPELASGFRFIVSPLERTRQTMGHDDGRLSQRIHPVVQAVVAVFV